MKLIDYVNIANIPTQDKLTIIAHFSIPNNWEIPTTDSMFPSEMVGESRRTGKTTFHVIATVIFMLQEKNAKIAMHEEKHQAYFLTVLDNLCTDLSLNYRREGSMIIPEVKQVVFEL